MFRFGRMGVLRAPEDSSPVAAGGATPAAAAATGSAPATPAAVPAQPVTVAPTVPAATPATPETERDPEWLDKRIEQAKRNAAASADKALLKALGVTSVDEAKAAIQASKDAELAKKTEIEKKDLRIKELEPAAQKAQTQGEVIRSYAALEMGKLTEGQRNTVTDFAGDDPEQQLVAIAKLQKNGLIAPVAAASAAAATSASGVPVPPPAARPTVPAPASTSAAPLAPAPAGGSPPDHKAEFDRLQKTNPMLAAQYAERHQAAIYPAGS